MVKHVAIFFILLEFHRVGPVFLRCFSSCFGIFYISPIKMPDSGECIFDIRCSYFVIKESTNIIEINILFSDCPACAYAYLILKSGSYTNLLKLNCKSARISGNNNSIGSFYRISAQKGSNLFGHLRSLFLKNEQKTHLNLFEERINKRR